MCKCEFEKLTIGKKPEISAWHFQTPISVVYQL